MEHLIRFRLLTDSLSQNEFDSFVTQTFNRLSKKDIILKGLFYLFHHQSTNTNLVEITNIVSDIIRSRNSKQLKGIQFNKQSIKLTLNDLPFELIGACGSYLNFNDYQSLQKVSRSIYIGCNDPITLTKMDKETFHKYSTYNRCRELIKYQKVQHFDIDILDFYDMIPIHNISLSKDTHSLSLYHSYQDTIKTFMNSKCFDFNNINVLKLNGSGPDVDTFCDLLKQFININFVELNCSSIKKTGFHAIFDNEEFRNKIFNHLQGVSLYGDGAELVRFYDHLLHYFSNKLISLHLDGNIKCPINGFRNLKELCINNANYNKINNIIQTTQKLERIHLEFTNADMDSKLENVLMELLSENTLEFISIKIYKNIAKIKNIFRRITFTKRKRLKIRLYVKIYDENVNEYYEILKSKLNQNTDIDDWMIIFVFMMCKTMKNIYDIKNIKYRTAISLWTSSQNCKINGIAERWLYPCVCNMKPILPRFHI